jgi:hypothetical protein
VAPVFEKSDCSDKSTASKWAPVSGNQTQIADRLAARWIAIPPAGDAGKQQISYSCIEP